MTKADNFTINFDHSVYTNIKSIDKNDKSFTKKYGFRNVRSNSRLRNYTGKS